MQRHGGTGNLTSVLTAPDRFWDELMAKSPQSIAGVGGWTAAAPDDLGKCHSASCEKSPLVAKFESESINAPTLAFKQRHAHSPVVMNDEGTHMMRRACGLHQHNRQALPPRRQFTRSITSTTALRFLHIPANMHRQLGLDDMYFKRTSGRRDNACTVYLVAGEARAPVVMLRTTSIRQHHRRFSRGWREFCAREGVEIGDDVVFERGMGNDLAVRVVKAGFVQQD